MPFFAVVVIVLVAWGAGAAVGSASTYLIGALVGVVITLVLVGVFGGIRAMRDPSLHENRGLPVP